MSYRALINVFGRDVAEIIVSFENKYARGAYNSVVKELDCIFTRSSSIVCLLRRFYQDIYLHSEKFYFNAIFKEIHIARLYHLRKHIQMFHVSLKELRGLGCEYIELINDVELINIINSIENSHLRNNAALNSISRARSNIIYHARRRASWDS